MDPDRRRLGELTFREYVDRVRKTFPAAAGDAGYMLARAASSQTLAEFAGADPEGDLPILRWADEAGPSARALARQTLTEWTATGVPHEGASPADIIAWREVCQVALNLIDF
jgi:hypothetical protein